MRTKLVMTLVTRDEDDILEKNICFHLNHGVDFIVAVNNGSKDSTRHVLEKYARIGLLAYKNVPEHTKEQSRWVTDLANLAVKKYHATHLIHVDTDEFWFPKSGNLKNHLPVNRQVGLVPSLNYLPPSFAQKLSLKRTVVSHPYSRHALFQTDESYRFLLFAQQPKVATTSHHTHIAQGNHLVISPGRVKYLPINGITIHHFPIRSFAQFKTKVKNGGSAYLNHPHSNPGIGWHQKSWYHYFQQGLLLDVYHQLTISASEKRLLFNNGNLSNIRLPLSILCAPIIFTLKRYYLRLVAIRSQFNSFRQKLVLNPAFD
ncbi:glycosyltransferase family 2 protein [Candidatus Shapirobacteria bacterium]|nr:glycosyltransferase family 2 protein [Candidatus Shapirobacteria bacterium]